MPRDEEATPERIAKLPAWARGHITHLERKLEEANKHIARQGNVVDYQTRRGVILNPNGERPTLLSDDTVRFWIEPDVFAIDVSMQDRAWNPRRGLLSIVGYGHRKSSSVLIYPSASNCFSIGGER